MSAAVLTASQAGLLSCLTCGLLSRPAPQAASACPRCGARLHARKPASLVRAWAFLASAMVLVVPVVVAYAFLQRNFIESMASSGVKG